MDHNSVSHTCYVVTESVFCNWNEQLEFHIHHVKEAARVVKLLSLLDSKTGKVAKKNPRCLTAKQSAVIEVNYDNITVVTNLICRSPFSVQAL